ncbi:unnamed protein product [uncultured bacterium]|nr:unnamed protein product [uncultured bacterium]
MKITIFTFLALSFLLGTQAMAADLQPGSIWKNDKGSTMTITNIDTATGIVSGTFVTGVGCGVGVARPLARPIHRI